MSRHIFSAKEVSIVGQGGGGSIAERDGIVGSHDAWHPLPPLLFNLAEVFGRLPFFNNFSSYCLNLIKINQRGVRLC